MAKHKILIIEDDKVILKFVSLALVTNGYEVLSSESGISGIGIFLSQNPDLILLDLGLPDLDGMEVLQQIREQKTTPVIVISARGRETDKVLALDHGANDYVTKPFNVGEVLARIRVALRNKSNLVVPESFEYKDLIIDFGKRYVQVHDVEVHLTPIEFKLLELLVTYQGKVLTHSFLQEQVWGYSTLDDYQSLRVFMASIRRKIETGDKDFKYIITEVGVGYRFKDE
ncbi:MAG TPA: DNA-binding response regulator [Acholeplasmataceae bacterium]|nr:DNA-binding response regulator [Acholeplasmataceae bacterium]